VTAFELATATTTVVSAIAVAAGKWARPLTDYLKLKAKLRFGTRLVKKTGDPASLAHAESYVRVCQSGENALPAATGEGGEHQ
jgi:hypothetical protein